jgi:transcriptional regulator with XRE-family HTH domain
MDSIGGRIKQVRKLAELNQVAFAQAIGISQGTLSELESNKFYPSVETLIQLHRKFGVDLNWIILGNNKL